MGVNCCKTKILCTYARSLGLNPILINVPSIPKQIVVFPTWVLDPATKSRTQEVDSHSSRSLLATERNSSLSSPSNDSLRLPSAKSFTNVLRFSLFVTLSKRFATFFRIEGSIRLKISQFLESPRFVIRSRSEDGERPVTVGILSVNFSSFLLGLEKDTSGKRYVFFDFIRETAYSYSTISVTDESLSCSERGCNVLLLASFK